MTELAKPDNFQDLIRDKIRTVIMNTIPDDQIDALINREYKYFFEDRIEGNYNKTVVQSPFKVIVNDEIRKFVTAKIQEFIKTKMTNVWDSEVNGNRLLEEVVKSHAPLAMESIMRNIVTNSFNQFRDNLNRY